MSSVRRYTGAGARFVHMSGSVRNLFAYPPPSSHTLDP